MILTLQGTSDRMQKNRLHAVNVPPVWELVGGGKLFRCRFLISTYLFLFYYFGKIELMLFL